LAAFNEGEPDLRKIGGGPAQNPQGKLVPGWKEPNSGCLSLTAKDITSERYKGWLIRPGVQGSSEEELPGLQRPVAEKFLLGKLEDPWAFQVLSKNPGQVGVT